MNSELGRYFEDRRLETQKLLRALYDVGTGVAPGVQVWIDGRELVFGASSVGRGFLRLIPGELHVVLAFPRGPELFDPRRRLQGPSHAQKSLIISQVFEIDPYVRRLIELAAALG